MWTSSLLISHERTGLKYEMSVHNYLRKAESEKWFWNNVLLHQESSIIPDIINVVFLLMKKQKHVQLNNCHGTDISDQGIEIRCPEEKNLCSVSSLFSLWIWSNTTNKREICISVCTESDWRVIMCNKSKLSYHRKNCHSSKWICVRQIRAKKRRLSSSLTSPLCFSPLLNTLCLLHCF